MVRRLVFPLCLAVASADHVAVSHQHGRELISTGCLDCCHRNDCRAGFNGMAGVCCSAATPGCCPLGASCVRCASRLRCTNSRMSTLAHRCSICSADSPPECSRHGRGDGSSAAANAFASVFAGVVVLGLLCCCCAAMILRVKERSQPHAVVGYVGPPGYVQPGAPGGGVYPGGVYPCGRGLVNNRGYCGSGLGVASGFVGGVLVGDVISHHRGGYEYDTHDDGGFDGADAGGDAGFDADM